MPIGVTQVAIELAMQGGDWAWAARALLRSLAVPRMLAGAGGRVVKRVLEVKELGESEPLLLAGAALAHAGLDIAESPCPRNIRAGPSSAGRDDGDRQSCLARHGNVAAARSTACRSCARLATSKKSWASSPCPIERWRPSFTSNRLLRGRVRAIAGAPRHCEVDVAAGRRPGRVTPGDANYAEQLVRADCSGQLSWLDAFCGDLRRATRGATSLLTDRQADSAETGVRFAHLATA